MAARTFKDHFSEASGNYSRYRPDYPAELFEWLASVSRQHGTAWDCATGNGQAALLLADFFNRVIATDASSSQIENAVKKRSVHYRVATAEDSGIAAGSVDLVTVAQAFHWFDSKAFSLEVDRVLKDAGILAIWTYNLLSVSKEIDTIVYHLYKTTLKDCWAFERTQVENGYRDVRLPFGEIDTPDLSMSTQWDLSQFIGYLCTWSAVKKYEAETGRNPVEELHGQIREAWGSPDRRRAINWPLSVRAWKKSCAFT
ncbi:MAG TPA: class I SAM-dependent methyltransferase [Thiolapillus brandeum]|uniref:Class I SAM-dependent methyltransferase n=1 Tax=Thiolapillus brandeum TaxID=1076588 RepID=A0A831S0J4_9GAMM|nr:class I SAM-dependent methyltransferase [Thiolapillus brandeum]